MSEDGKLTPEQIELVHDGRAWGFMIGATFVEIPKEPLLLAGLSNPPFYVEMPDGKMRHIIERPADE